MSDKSATFDRMVRVESNLHRAASVVSAMEGKTLKDFVDEAIREKIGDLQTVVYTLPNIRPAAVRKSDTSLT